MEQNVLDVAKLEAAMAEILHTAPVDAIDYARIVDALTLEPLEQIDDVAVAIIAARLGTTRLIDNLTLSRR